MCPHKCGQVSTLYSSMFRTQMCTSGMQLIPLSGLNILSHTAQQVSEDMHIFYSAVFSGPLCVCDCTAWTSVDWIGIAKNLICWHGATNNDGFGPRSFEVAQTTFSFLTKNATSKEYIDGGSCVTRG